jgi:hypothetical protein
MQAMWTAIWTVLDDIILRTPIMNYSSYPNHRENGGHDPASIDPDSAIREIADALHDESVALAQADARLDHLLKVLAMHLQRHDLDVDGHARLVVLQLVGDTLKRAIDQRRRLQRNVRALKRRYCSPHAVAWERTGYPSRAADRFCHRVDTTRERLAAIARMDRPV